MTYIMFYVADVMDEEIVIFRVLKDREDWQVILHRQTEYHF